MNRLGLRVYVLLGVFYAKLFAEPRIPAGSYARGQCDWPIYCIFLLRFHDKSPSNTQVRRWFSLLMAGLTEGQVAYLNTAQEARGGDLDYQSLELE